MDSKQPVIIEREVTLTVVALLFAGMKCFRDFGGLSYVSEKDLCVVCIALFTLFHILFYYYYSRSSGRITDLKSLSAMKRIALRDELKRTMRYIVVRAIGCCIFFYYFGYMEFFLVVSYLGYADLYPFSPYFQ